MPPRLLAALLAGPPLLLLILALAIGLSVSVNSIITSFNTVVTTMMITIIPYHIVQPHVGGDRMFKWSVCRKNFDNPVRSQMRPLEQTQQNPPHCHTR